MSHVNLSIQKIQTQSAVSSWYVSYLEVLFVFLDLNHYVVYVEELSLHWDILEWLQSEELGETMVKLDHLRQDSLGGYTRGGRQHFW